MAAHVKREITHFTHTHTHNADIIKHKKKEKKKDIES